MPKGIADPNRANRCVGHKKDGERCRNSAINGGKVCRKHGGAAPQVQRAARERFNDSIDPMLNAMAQMAKEIEDGTISAEDRRFFMKFVADRTGFVPGQKISHDGPPAWIGVMQGVIKEVQPGSDIAMELLKVPGVNQPTLEDIEDAVVIEEDIDPRGAARAALPHLPRPEDRKPRRMTEPPNRWANAYND